MSGNVTVKAGQMAVTIVFNTVTGATMSGVPTVKFSKGGTDNGTVSGSYISENTWSGTVNIASGYDGTQTLSISGATDTNGKHIVADASRTFLVDTTAPVVAFTDPTVDKPVNATAYTITGTAADTPAQGADVASGLAKVEVSINNGTSWADAYTSVQAALTASASGDQTVRIWGPFK